MVIHNPDFFKKINKRLGNHYDLILVLASSFFCFLLSLGLYFFVWLAFAPLIIAIYKKPFKKALLLGTLCGVTFSSLFYSWIFSYKLEIYLIAVSINSGFFIVFSLMTNYLSKKIKKVSFIFIPSLIWSIFQIILSYTPFSNYWLDLTILQPMTAPLIWFIGGIGVTFLVLLINSTIALWLIKKDKKLLIIGAVLLLIFLSCWTYSNFAVPSGEKVKVALIQGNFPETWKWRQKHADSIIFNTYKELTLEAEKQNPDFIIWPEYALPLDIIYYNKKLFEKVSNLSKELDSVLVLGSLFYNSSTGYHTDAALIFYDGEYRGAYESINPAFFNEYTIPSNKRLHIFNISSEFGITVCYEETQPEIYREYANKGANFIISLSNNQNFSRGTKLVSLYSRARAAENRKYVVRATNTGITQIINPYGKIAAMAPPSHRNILIGDIYLNNNKTFFTKYGNTLIYLTIIFFIILFIKEGRWNRKK